MQNVFKYGCENIKLNFKKLNEIQIEITNFYQTLQEIKKKNFVVKLKSKNLIINEIGPEMLQSLNKNY